MKNNSYIAIATLFTLLFSGLLSYAQVGEHYIRKGNRLFYERDYVNAEFYYNKSLKKDNNNKIAQYNQGTALYKQSKFYEATVAFQGISLEDCDSSFCFKVIYNKANSQLKDALASQKRHKERIIDLLKSSISDYEMALAYNPGDQNAKYNLTYAKEMLKQQQNQQKQSQQQKKQQDKEKEKKQSHQEQNFEQGNISRGDAERILRAISKQEEITEKMINSRKSKGGQSPANGKKNW